MSHGQAGPQFSTPSLQELLLTARTGADAGAGAIRSASEGFGQGADLVRKRRAAEIKAQLDERGQALKEETLAAETDLGQQRVDATRDQTDATRDSVTSRENTATSERKAKAPLRKAQKNLAQAQADLLNRGGKEKGKTKADITDVEIDKLAEEQKNAKLKLLANEIQFLSEPDKAAMEAQLKKAAVLEISQARDRDRAARVGGTIDPDTGQVPVIDENGLPGFAKAASVQRWLQANPKRKVR